jgi:N-hydroxyarylamine O-acetyltransferase
MHECRRRILLGAVFLKPSFCPRPALMKAENFSLPAYLDRIGFDASVFSSNSKPDIAAVKAMMQAQLFTVPFENLDVQAGKIVSLVPEQIVEKIVHQRRGGYCYEVNGLFAMALTALGIDYQFVAARPMFYPVRRPKTHMALIVTLDGVQWLCDLGFGSYGIRAPMRLDMPGQQVQQDFDTFVLESDPSAQSGFLLLALVGGEWANQYGFDLSPQEWIDFAPANYLNSTHPDSVFVQKYLVVQHHPQGRHILFGDVLKTVSEGRTESQDVPPGQRAAVLAEVFGLNLPG